MSDGGGDEEFDSTDAFALLSDETRAEIVRVLHEGPVDTPVPFSTLYEHVDGGDTAKFNYHLGELRPHFVTKTDAGYELTAAGRRLARAVVAGTYTDSPRVEPFDVEGRCYACGERALSASYEEELFAVECRACGEAVLAVRVPPTVVRGRDPADVADAFERWSRYQAEQAREGVCPDCGGPVERSVTEDVVDTVEFDAVARFECRICGRQVLTSFGAVAYRHPAVQAFHRRRGESLRERHIWEVDQFVAGEGVEVRSRDPWRVRVSFRADGDACHVDVDGDLNVVRIEIVPGDGTDA